MRTAKRAHWALTFALLALCVVGGFLLARYMPTAGEAPPRVLLDARGPVDSMGAVFAFTMDTPGVLRVTVHLERCCEDTEVKAAFGPLVPALRPHLVYEPDLPKDVNFMVTPTSTGPGLLEAKRPGVYAVRIDTIPSAMGGDDEAVAVVRVEWVGGL